jgi:hypothetical protein
MIRMSVAYHGAFNRSPYRIEMKVPYRTVEPFGRRLEQEIRAKHDSIVACLSLKTRRIFCRSRVAARAHSPILRN